MGGEEPVWITKLPYDNHKLLVWQYHQHKMLDEVQAGREPLKYLWRFL